MNFAALRLALVLLAGTTCLTAPALAYTPYGAETSAQDTLALQAVERAKEALRDYRSAKQDLRYADTAKEAASLRAHIDDLTRAALEEVFAIVKDTVRNDPASRVLIYQIAQDALGSGNNSADVDKRVAYRLDALRKIAGIRP